MTKFTVTKENLSVDMNLIPLDDDLCVIISSQTYRHIGCVTLSVPRPSLKDKNKISATTSILNMIGHKDDEVAKYISNELAAKLNKNVTVVCGIHFENISPNQIKTVQSIIAELLDSAIKYFS